MQTNLFPQEELKESLERAVKRLKPIDTARMIHYLNVLKLTRCELKKCFDGAGSQYVTLGLKTCANLDALARRARMGEPSIMVRRVLCQEFPHHTYFDDANSEYPIGDQYTVEGPAMYEGLAGELRMLFLDYCEEVLEAALQERVNNR